jgi:hypothetical protein
MKVRYSVFLNDIYFNQFLVLYKSFLFYNHKYKFRVYDYDNLSQERLQTLKDIGVEVQKVQQGDWSELTFRFHYGFKWKGILESDCDIEILLDADTMFLDNLDDLVELTKQHKLVVVPEHHTNYRSGNLFNIGLLGINKDGKSLVLSSVQRMNEQPYRDGSVPNTEMFSLCDIVEEGKEDVLELDYLQYMHLWHNHKLLKTVEVHDGKFVVKNQDGTRVRFYHFTTHIDPFNGSPVLRFAYDKITANRMWVKRFNNPVGLIYNYFDYNEDFSTIKEKTSEWKLK